MKITLLLLFLTLSLSVYSQTALDQEYNRAVEDTVNERMQPAKSNPPNRKHVVSQLSLPNSPYLKNPGSKAKDMVKDNLWSTPTPLFEHDTSSLGQLPNKADSMILLKAKSELQEELTKVPVTDSILTKQLGNKAREIVQDTLKSMPGLFLDNGINVAERLSRQKIDSSIVGKGKPNAKKAIVDSLHNYMDMPDVGLDSTIANHINVEVKKRAGAAINKKGIKVPDITIDSTLNDQIRAEGQTKARTALEDEAGTDISDITIDSTTATQLKKEVVRRAENSVKGREEFTSMEDLKKSSEIDELKNQRDKLEQKQAELAQAASKQEIKEKLASHARQYIAKHADKIQEVQSKIGKLKKRYSSMPNSNDLSSAVKRTSLNGEPLWKRLVIGGNFTIGRTSPFSIDLSPVIGYKVNKLFELGTTAVYRTRINVDKKGISLKDGNVYGYGLFASHMVFGSFFGYLEGERITSTSINPEKRQREWRELLLAGIGKKFNVSKWLEMQTMVLVNVLHDNGDGLYNSPVVFKTAVRLR